ncbi:uncharacterized protein LACBIDRAFT_316446 [Laccaria bicolor S238N-H82]|uniref:Predicted protein n=1 Tax=Laccaria bicolor (strain S238N-H82 / ATCC MYA-4686) TaxID=486041 RepID=B0E0Z7_LACBS|nr:uncharacterized protein LACBIDRAFT_316446 [Laccaria bicolor S238N-H82]EDQ99527.1 predicted protein [Laccaria bicolor S238N-H82]|eukprot:XP_001889876.1 predicted protein [Laccaria bicolor S238N-H82]
MMETRLTQTTQLFQLSSCKRSGYLQTRCLMRPMQLFQPSSHKKLAYVQMS